MQTILTPISLWKNFDDSLPLMDVTTDITSRDGITYERVKFLGRETGSGRVSVFGVLAYAQDAPAKDGVLIIPDSCRTVEEDMLALVVKNGYSAFMVDIRGEWEGCSDYTVYPESVYYANFTKAGRYLDYADEGADKTSWYEWVAVGLYARRFLKERLGCAKIGVVGIRDGGEVVWKLAHAGDFACAVPVCAGGWRAYKGYNKFGGGEPEFDEERRRFVAGVDSQAYAPYVRCPVLMLCSTNDPDFDYDRAYDTFSRINQQFIDESVIAYSIKSNAGIGMKSVKDMFMFFDKYVKDRQVFIPRPAELVIGVDDNSNLVGRAVVDDSGEVDDVKMYMAEDCTDCVVRDWFSARSAEGSDDSFYLDVYSKTSILFAICYVTYTNGFTVWSKITVKKLGGAFRNSRKKSKVVYSASGDSDCFSLADGSGHSVAGTFFTREDFFPRVVECGGGLKGIYSPCGITTYRFNSPAYAPSPDSMLTFDIYVKENCNLSITLTDVAGGEKYILIYPLVGDVWQNVVLESKLFKTMDGKTLPDFGVGLEFTLNCPSEYAVNNVMWL